MNSQTKIDIGFVIGNNFSMLELSEIMEPLTVAYKTMGNIQHNFSVYADSGSFQTSSCNTTLPSKPLSEMSSSPDLLFILSPFSQTKKESPCLEQTIRQLSGNNTVIVGVGKGIQWLYESKVIGPNHISSGLIDRSVNGNISIRRGLLYSIRQNTVLCVGGSACLDMTLKLISVMHGKEISVKTAEKLSCPLIRSPKHHRYETQTLTTDWPQDLKDVSILMKNNIREPLKITEICTHLNISSYQLHLLFKNHIGIPPAQYYGDLRIMQVHTLLSETNLSIKEIAKETGHTNISALYKKFKQRFGEPPCLSKSSSAF